MLQSHEVVFQEIKKRLISQKKKLQKKHFLCIYMDEKTEVQNSREMLLYSKSSKQK